MGSGASGLLAGVNGQTSLRNWSLNITGAAKTAVNSGTKIGTARKRGIRDWTGGMEEHGYAPTVMPGGTFAFAGYTGGSASYSGNAIIDQYTLNLNWEGGDIISQSLSFSGDGPVAEGTTVVADSAAVQPVSVLEGAKITVIPAGDAPEESSSGSGSGSEEVEIEDLVNATLTISSANVSRVNSSTAGWTARRKGPIDWTLALNLHNDSALAIGLDEGSNYEIRIYVTEDLYWSLKWGHVEPFTNIKADRETGAPIAATINIGMQAIVTLEDVATLGSIILPGEVTPWWPAAA